MKVALFEVCRRPEVDKPDTEAIILSECFQKLGIDFELYSNDGYWHERPKSGANVTRTVLQKCLADPSISVVHFAVHGGPTGLALKWKGSINDREEADILTAPEIRKLKGLRNRLVVSGACGSAWMAEDFLAAGATAFVAPEVEIPWANLGMMFRKFYGSLSKGSSAPAALKKAISGHPELASYRIYLPD